MPDEPAIATGPRGVVMLVPFGKFPTAQVDAVADHLRAHAQVEVRTQAAVPLPKAAWYAPRQRYRADALLDHLEAMYADAPSTTRVLGLTTFDISTSKPPHDDWGIFGLGQMPGRAAVVSTFRLRRKAKNPAHVQRRLATTALHELGHTFGLDHCTEPLCPMQDAEGSIANTDSANDDFGPECLRAIDRLAPRAAAPQ
jgi:archaemetzincin